MIFWSVAEKSKIVCTRMQQFIDALQNPSFELRCAPYEMQFVHLFFTTYHLSRLGRKASKIYSHTMRQVKALFFLTNGAIDECQRNIPSWSHFKKSFTQKVRIFFEDGCPDTLCILICSLWLQSSYSKSLWWQSLTTLKYYDKQKVFFHFPLSVWSRADPRLPIFFASNVWRHIRPERGK